MSQRVETGVFNPDFINKVKMICMQCGAELDYDVFIAERSDGIEIRCVRCCYEYYFGE